MKEIYCLVYYKKKWIGNTWYYNYYLFIAPKIIKYKKNDDHLLYFWTLSPYDFDIIVCELWKFDFLFKLKKRKKFNKEVHRKDVIRQFVSSIDDYCVSCIQMKKICLINELIRYLRYLILIFIRVSRVSNDF